MFSTTTLAVTFLDFSITIVASVFVTDSYLSVPLYVTVTGYDPVSKFGIVSIPFPLVIAIGYVVLSMVA